MLTDKAVRAAVGREKAYKLADSQGLFLYVSPGGSRIWRYKFRFEGKEQLLTFGTYPDVSLAAARANRDEARKTLREGRDPRRVVKRAKLLATVDQSRTLESVARRWHAVQKRKWKPVHANDVIRSLERDAFPDLGPCQWKRSTSRHC